MCYLPMNKCNSQPSSFSYLPTNMCNSQPSSLCYLPMNMCNSRPSSCTTYLLRYIKQYNLLYMLIALEHVIHSLLHMLLANKHMQFTAFFIYYLLTNMCNSKPHQQTYAIHSILHLQLANKHVQFTALPTNISNSQPSSFTTC